MSSNHLCKDDPWGGCDEISPSESPSGSSERPESMDTTDGLLTGRILGIPESSAQTEASPNGNLLQDPSYQSVEPPPRQVYSDEGYTKEELEKRFWYIPDEIPEGIELINPQYRLAISRVEPTDNSVPIMDYYHPAMKTEDIDCDMLMKIYEWQIETESYYAKNSFSDDEDDDEPTPPNSDEKNPSQP